MAFEAQKAKAEEVLEANRQANTGYAANGELARHAGTAAMLLSVIAEYEALAAVEAKKG